MSWLFVNKQVNETMEFILIIDIFHTYQNISCCSIHACIQTWINSLKETSRQLCTLIQSRFCFFGYIHIVNIFSSLWTFRHVDLLILMMHVIYNELWLLYRMMYLLVPKLSQQHISCFDVWLPR